MGRHTSADEMNIAALLAGLFSGIIASMGMGGGAVLLIYLTVFAGTEQLKAQGINLIFFLPIGLLALIIYIIKKKIDWKKDIIIAVFGVLGAFLGLGITNLIDSSWISKIFAVFLILLGLKETFGSKQNNSCK